MLLFENVLQYESKQVKAERWSDDDDARDKRKKESYSMYSIEA